MMLQWWTGLSIRPCSPSLRPPRVARGNKQRPSHDVTQQRDIGWDPLPQCRVVAEALPAQVRLVSPREVL